MEEYTLEQEFLVYVDRHKEKTLMDDITRHYTDLYKTGVQIPEFMIDKTPLEMANEDYKKVVECNNSLALDKLYQDAYQRNVKFIQGWGEQKSIVTY